MSKPNTHDLPSRVMLTIAAIALIVMMTVVVADVLLRGVFNHPVRGAYDVVSFALLVMAMCGMAPVIAERSEILIDLIDHIAAPRFVRLLKRAAAFLGIGLFAFIGWSMVAPATDAWRYGDRSLELGIPLWVLWVISFVGIAGVFWGYVRQFVQSADEESAE